MNNNKLRTSSYGLVFGMLLCALSMVFHAPMTAEAAKAPTCAKTQTITLTQIPGEMKNYVPKTKSQFIYIKNAAADAKIYDIKVTGNVSDSIKTDKFYSTTENSIYEDVKTAPKAVYLTATAPLVGLKNGQSCTVSFKVKQNKRVYKLSCKVKFQIASTGDFKKLKVGKKDLTKQTRYRFYPKDSVKTAGKKVKINAAMKAGYKLQKIEVQRVIDEEYQVVTKLSGSGTAELKKGDLVIIYYYPNKRPAGSPSNIIKFFRQACLENFSFTVS